MEVFWVVFWFRKGPIWSQVGDIPMRVEDWVVSRRKIDLCADLEDVQLDLNHLKMGSGSRLFLKRNFGWFLGSCKVP